MTELTVVLPTKNSEKNIDIFLKSLEQQSFQDFKLFVADGSSNDNTLKIIRKYNFDLTIISENDTSAEDGINKCLKQVKTQYFCLCNSDDKLGQENYFSTLISELKFGADIAFPNFGSITNNKLKIINQSNDFKKLIYHNAVPDIGWMAKTLVLKEGLFPEKYKLASAYFFLLKLFKKGYNFKRNTNVHYYFRIGGNSYKNGISAFTEQKDVSLEFGANKFYIYMILLNNLSKFIIKYKILKFWNKVT